MPNPVLDANANAVKTATNQSGATASLSGISTNATSGVIFVSIACGPGGATGVTTTAPTVSTQGSGSSTIGTFTKAKTGVSVGTTNSQTLLSIPTGIIIVFIIGTTGSLSSGNNYGTINMTTSATNNINIGGNIYNIDGTTGVFSYVSGGGGTQTLEIAYQYAQ